MAIKMLVVGIMLFILFCLGSGLYYLVHDQSHSKRTVKALTWRIGLSLFLFLLLMLLFFLGIITPHSLR